MVDYSSFRDPDDPSKKASNAREKPTIVCWWLAKPGVELADAVFGQVSALVQADGMRIQQYNTHARLYGNQMSSLSNSGFTMTSINANQSPVRNAMGFNLIQSCIDTLTSKMAKNRVLPYFLTSKGNSRIQRKAQGLNDFTAGIFYENKSGYMMPIMFRDACVWGEGIIRVFNNHGRVAWRRVLPYQVLTDFLECHEGPQNAKTLHFIAQVDRSTLARLMPKKAGEIEQLANTNALLSNTTRSVSDTVMIVESFRLPSAPGESDGLHCITAPGVTLMVEDYDKMFFPFGVLRYSPRLHGFWGQGLAEQLTPIQTELNRCLMTVQRSFHLGGSFKVLIHNTSKIVKSHIDNTIGSIITWAGDHLPQYITPPMVQPEIFAQIQNLKQMGYEQSGISQLSAASNKPAGLNSGKALRETIDIETDRFQMVGQGYEDTGVELGMLSIMTAKDIYKKDKKSITVKVPSKRFITKMDWDDVDIEEDDFVMQCFPKSKLPSTPEGKLESIQELMQAGIIDPQTGRRLLDFPDLDEEEKLANAQQDYLHMILGKIVDDGEYTVLDPATTPILAIKLGVEYYFMALRDNLELERQNMLRQFIAKASEYQQQATPPPQGLPTTSPPQAVPQAPPMSNLLPNAPGGGAAA